MKLCIDSGGTKIEYAVFDDNSQMLENEIIYFEGNLVQNFDNTFKKFEEIIIMMNKYAPLDVLIGAAGVLALGEKLKPALANLKDMSEVNRIEIFPDVILSALVNLEDNDGLIVVLGTGSALISKKNNDFRIFGGYGHILGDDGSGYDFGNRLIKEYLFLKENKIKSIFISKIESHFRTKNEREIVGKITANAKAELSSLAKVFIDQEFCNYITLEFLNDLNRNISQKMIVTDAPRIVLDGSITKSLEVRKYFSKYDHISFATPQIIRGILYHQFKE